MIIHGFNRLLSLEDPNHGGLQGNGSIPSFIYTADLNSDLRTLIHDDFVINLSSRYHRVILVLLLILAAIFKPTVAVEFTTTVHWADCLFYWNISLICRPNYDHRKNFTDSIKIHFCAPVCLVMLPLRNGFLMLS